MSENNKKPLITDYIYVLYKWKRFFFIIMFIILLITSGLALLKPNQYKATASFMIPANKEFGLGGLGGLLSGESSALDIGSRLLGVTGTNEDMMLGFMKTKIVIDQIASKYNLYDYYEIDDRIYEDLYLALNDDLIFDANEYGYMETSVISTDSVMATKMVMDFIHLADSLNVHFNILQAKNFREFVEKRYDQTLRDLKNAEENYYSFQKEYGAFDVPEQIKALILASSELEVEVIQQEIILEGMRNKLGTNTPQFKEQKLNLDEFKKQLESLYNGKLENDFFIALQDIPDLQINYIRYYRDLEIQNRTLKFVYPIVEQARIDEQKNMPTVLIIDDAFVPQKKHSPKRSFIVLGVGFFSFWILLALILRGEKVLSRKEKENVIEEKEYNFYNKLASIFKVQI